jgi:hypothetical protein
MPGWKYEPVFSPVGEPPRSRFLALIVAAAKSGLVVALCGYIGLTVFIFVQTGRLDFAVSPGELPHWLPFHR